MARARDAGRVCFIGGFAYDALTSRQRRDYEQVKAAVLEDGGYCAFDASDSPTSARIFTRIDNDPELSRSTDTPYPWVKVERRELPVRPAPALLEPRLAADR